MSTKKKKGTQDRPSTFPAECRRDAVALVLDEDRTIALRGAFAPVLATSTAVMVSITG